MALMAIDPSLFVVADVADDRIARIAGEAR
jgi:hypothetical protein